MYYLYEHIIAKANSDFNFTSQRSSVQSILWRKSHSHDSSAESNASGSFPDSVGTGNNPADGRNDKGNGW